jgi:cell shape-determining protein MreC
MTYLSGKFTKRKSYKKYFFFVSVFLLVVFTWKYSRPVLFPVVEPFTQLYGDGKQSVSFLPRFLVTYVTSRQSLLIKERNLEENIERLENEIAQKDALLREYALQNGFSTSSHSGLHPLVMYPLMQDVTKLYSSVLLSKGFKDGVEIGDAVFLRGNQVVCTVQEVYNSSSRCLLLTASGITTEGVTSSSTIVLALVGRGGHFIADIARDTPVEVGEKVYLRSDPSMVLGIVKEVLNNNQDTSWHVIVEGAYNPVASSLFYVRKK